MKLPSFKTSVACILNAALLVGIPGLPSYEAAAAILRQQPHGQRAGAMPQATLPSLTVPGPQTQPAPGAPLRDAAAVKESAAVNGAAAQDPSKAEPVADAVAEFGKIDQGALTQTGADSSVHAVGANVEGFLTSRRAAAAHMAAPEPSVPSFGGRGLTWPGLKGARVESAGFESGPSSPRGPPEPPQADIDAAAKSARFSRQTRTFAALSAFAAGAGGTAWLLVAKTGLEGLMPALNLFAGFMLLPIVLELAGRLFRRDAPKPDESKNLDEKQYPEIYAMVRQLSERAGLKMPTLQMLDMGDAPNAAATGVESPMLVTKTYVYFTPGILKLMTPKELAAIIGHELSHIRHHDIAITVGILVLSFFAWINAISLPVTALAMFALVASGTILKAYVSRQREFLADLGGAELSRDPKSMSSSLLKLDMWMRLVAGMNHTPVGVRGFQDLTLSHPNTMARLESLKSVFRPGSPRSRARFGAVGAVAASLVGLLSLFDANMLVSLAIVKGGGLMTLLYGFAAAMGVQAVSGLIQLLSSRGPAVAKDRFLAYLTHPDEQFRRWSASALRHLAGRSEKPKMIAAASAAVKQALETERDPVVKALLASAGKRLGAMETLLPRRERRKELAKTREIVAAFDAAAYEPPEAEDAYQRLKNAKEPKFLSDLAGPPVLEVLRSMTLKVSKVDVGVADEAVPYRLDRKNSTLYVSNTLWARLSEVQRAGLLYRQAATLKAARAHEASGKGKLWVDSDDAVRTLKKAIRNYTPIDGAGPFDAARLGKPKDEPKKDAPAAAKAKVGIEDAKSGVDQAARGLGSAGLVAALMFGGAVGFAASLLAAPLGLSLMIGFYAGYTYGHLHSLPWAGRALGSAVNALPFALIPAALALAGVAAGHSFVIPWVLMSSIVHYVLESGLKRGKLGRGEAASALIFTAGVAAPLLMGASELLVLAHTVISAGLYFHLARHDAAGTKNWALIGFALTAMSWAFFAFGLSNLLFLAGPLLLAHFAGNRLTK